jgi:hypothetical protein
MNVRESTYGAGDIAALNDIDPSMGAEIREERASVGVGLFLLGDYEVRRTTMLVDLAKLSRVVSMSLATGMALATGIGSALAQEEPSVQQIIEALKPKHLTRSLDPGTAPVSAPESNPDLPFIDSLRNRTARSLTPPGARTN